MTGPSNPHLADPLLKPFLIPTFSPVDYLNFHLPTAPSAGSKTNAQSTQSSGSSLSQLSTQSQTHLNQLSAQQARLLTTLTDLTNDILRTSSRLAYEVELLRGEAFSLAEMLSTKSDIHEAILQFVPYGLSAPSLASPLPTSRRSEDQLAAMKDFTLPNEPASLPRLKTLHHVRNQLVLVREIFNTALSLPFPPSLLSSTAATAAASLISVNPPDSQGASRSGAAAATDTDAVERAGKAVLDTMKSEIDIMIREKNFIDAYERISLIAQVGVGVWKGTAEEKGRQRWIDGLEASVRDAAQQEKDKLDQIEAAARKSSEEQERRPHMSGPGAALLASLPQRPGSTPLPNASSAGGAAGTKPAAGGSGAGFFRRLRDEIYFE